MHTGWFRRKRLSDRALIIRHMDLAIVREGGPDKMTQDELRWVTYFMIVYVAHYMWLQNKTIKLVEPLLYEFHGRGQKMRINKNSDNRKNQICKKKNYIQISVDNVFRL